LVNVGANTGYYCCLALDRNKYVIAFEPINLNVKYLLRNIKANNWDDRIEVYPMLYQIKNQVQLKFMVEELEHHLFVVGLGFL